MVLVMNVLRVNTVRAVWNRLRAMHAPLVLVKVTKDKLRVQNAAPVNSTMWPVRSIAHCVQIRRTLVTREETAVASIVQLVGRPLVAVLNVKRAGLERSVLGVKNVL